MSRFDEARCYKLESLPYLGWVATRVLLNEDLAELGRLLYSANGKLEGRQEMEGPCNLVRS
jgi:hypothetical protein